MPRVQYQIPLRVVKRGSGDVGHKKYVAGAAIKNGQLLTINANGEVLPVVGSNGVINSTTIAGPIRFIALEDASSGNYVAVAELGPFTVLEAQVRTGKVTYASIGERRDLFYHSPSGRYTLGTNTTNPVVEVVDVEQNFAPFSDDANKDFNLAWFRVLPSILQAAPA